MVTYRTAREIALDVLSGGKPLAVMEVARRAGLTRSSAGNALAWRRGLVLRTAEPFYETQKVNKGRGGVSVHIRPYHLYIRRSGGREEVMIEGHRYVTFSPEYLDPRGGGNESKAGLVLGYLKENPERAFFSKEIVEALKDRGVKMRDIMTARALHIDDIFTQHDPIHKRGRTPCRSAQKTCTPAKTPI